MKRIGTILCLSFILIAMSTPICLAAATSQQGGLTIKDQYPKDGATGTSAESISVKIWFDQDVHPKTKEIRKANKAKVKLVDNKGKELPIYVAYNPDEEGQVMVLTDNKTQIKDDTKYTLTIDPGFQATNGDTLATQDKVTFKTLNRSQATMVNMIMMGVMMVGMIFFSSRSMKKQQEKERASKGKTETVNPYKEAKRTGKSVEEIVEKDKKNKEKQAAAAARRAEKQKQIEKEIEEKKSVSNTKRVAGPRPISAGGGKYKAPKKKPEPQVKNKGAGSKNQTGKQRNTKNQSKKKKK